MNILLGLDSWYPQVDGVTTVVVNYDKLINSTEGDNTENSFHSVVTAPSYGEKLDQKGKTTYFQNVKHYRSLYFPIGNFRLGMPMLDKQLKREIKQGKYDILHVHSPFFLLGFFNRIGKKNHVPVIFHFHTKFKDEFMRYTHSRLLTAICMAYIMHNINRADYVWTVSDGAAQTLKEYGYKGQIHVVRNGTDYTPPTPEQRATLAQQVDEEYGLAGQKNVFLFTGRVVSVKNLTFTFDVLKELKDRGVDFKFVVVGDGEQLEEYKKRVQDMGIADNVLFTGVILDRQKLQAFYCRADLFLFPSIFDTAALSMLEAVACTTPVFVPQGSAPAEVLNDGVNGYTPELKVDVWANRIQQAIADPEQLKKVGQNAKEQVFYSWQKAVATAMKKYGEVLDDYHKKG